MKIPDKKLNRSRRRSQRLIKMAFMELIHEKKYSKITISDITERADIARPTFYANFGTKKAVIKSIMEDLIDIEPGYDYRAFYEKVFAICVENKKIIMPLFQSGLSADVLEFFNEFAFDYFETIIDTLNLELSNDTLKVYILKSAVGSFFMLLTAWIENDMAETPAQMTDITTQIVENGFINTLDWVGFVPKEK